MGKNYNLKENILCKLLSIAIGDRSDYGSLCLETAHRGEKKMNRKFRKSIGKDRLLDLLSRVQTREAAAPLATAAEPVGCCAIVTNGRSELRTTTRRICDLIEQELDGAGSTQFFPDPCRA